MPINFSKVIDLSPFGVLVCDHNKRIIWHNDRFLSDTGLQEEQVKNQLRAALPLESVDKDNHLVQLFTGNSQQPKRFHYWRTKDPADDALVYHYYALERQAVNQSLAEKANLPKRASWLEFLEYEISRSRRYANPLMILKLQVLIDSAAGGNTIDETAVEQCINDTLMDELRWADMIGQTSQYGYLMVLPETPAGALSVLKDKLVTAIEKQLSRMDNSLKIRVIFGSTAWQKHDDGQQMIMRARQDLVENLEKSMN